MSTAADINHSPMIFSIKKFTLVLDAIVGVTILSPVLYSNVYCKILNRNTIRVLNFAG